VVVHVLEITAVKEEVLFESPCLEYLVIYLIGDADQLDLAIDEGQQHPHHHRDSYGTRGEQRKHRGEPTANTDLGAGEQGFFGLSSRHGRMFDDVEFPYHRARFVHSPPNRREASSRGISGRAP